MRPEPQHAPSPSPCASPRHLPKGPLTSPGQRRGWEWPLGPWVPSPGPGALTAPEPPHPQPRPGTTGQGLATPQASPAAPELQLHPLLPRALSSSGPSVAIAPHWFGPDSRPKALLPHPGALCLHWPHNRCLSPSPTTFPELTSHIY